jgi:hypothetical protein
MNSFALYFLGAFFLNSYFEFGLSLTKGAISVFNLSLVWFPGQNKRMAILSLFHGCRKRRLKDE